MANQLQTVAGATAQERALRALMRSAGHQPERRADETYGQRQFSCSIHCAECHRRGRVYANETEARFSGDALTERCGEEA